MAHVCHECGKQLSRSTTLKQHMTIHTGERLFTCGTCKRSFARKWDLTKHEEIHGGYHRFRCCFVEDTSTWGCGQAFRKKSDLTRHLRRKASTRCRKLVERDETATSSSLVDTPDDLAACEASDGDTAPKATARPSTPSSTSSRAARDPSTPSTFHPQSHSGTSVLAHYPIFEDEAKHFTADELSRYDDLDEIATSLAKVIDEICYCAEAADLSTQTFTPLHLLGAPHLTGTGPVCAGWPSGTVSVSAMLQDWHAKAKRLLGPDSKNFFPPWLEAGSLKGERNLNRNDIGEVLHRLREQCRLSLITKDVVFSGVLLRSLGGGILRTQIGGEGVHGL
jgi:hypothetical protein